MSAVTVACGATSTPPREARHGPAPEMEAALDAWRRLDPETAADLATQVADAGGEDADDARELAARAHLAAGDHRAAIDLLTGVDRPAWLLIRARAQLADDDLEGAEASLRAARQRLREEDPWVEAMLPAVSAAAANGRPYVIAGDEAELALESAPLPLVRVRVDAFETWALVGSSSDLAVLDPSIRDRAGAIDELELGSITVRNVPHIVRSLADVSGALEREVGMVIGAELLLRLHATVDGPGSRVVVRASAPSTTRATTATRAPIRMLSGSFLSVTARVGDNEGWLTVDTAGLFPIALTPDGLEELGLEGLEWTTLEGGGETSLAAVPALRLGNMEIEGIPAVRGLLGESHARAVGAPVAGSLGWALLRQLRTRFDRDGRALVFE